MKMYVRVCIHTHIYIESRLRWIASCWLLPLVFIFAENVLYDQASVVEDRRALDHINRRNLLITAKRLQLTQHALTIN